MPIGPDPTRPTAFIPFVGHFRSGNKTGGNAQWLTAVFVSPNVDTTFAIALGSAPDGYFQFAASVPGTVYNDTNQGALNTPDKIILRATAAGTYRLLLS